MEGNDDTGSAVSEREVAAVTLNLARLHDLIDDRRAAAVQAARTFCHEEHIPSVAILSNESLQVRIPMPDILAAIEDISASPVSEGISNGGYVDLDPATITPEGMHLLQACFVNRELKMAEDKGGYGMLLHLLRREHTEAQCKHFQSAVTRISNLQHKPLVLLPYLFAKQLCPSGLTCPHCHAHLLYILLRTKCTPTKAGVVTEIHSSASSCVVIWKVPRFRQLSQPTYSFDFRTPQNRVLHMRIDPRGFGRGRDSHLSVFFKESQALEEDVNFHFVLGVTSSSQDAFVKPMLNCVLSKSRREYTGRQAFMPLEMIQNGGYIEPDGSLLIMLEIVELPSEPAAATTEQ